MLRRALGPCVLVILVAIAAWLLSSVGPFDIIKFLAYDAVFVALPGMALLWAVRKRRSHFLVTIAVGWPLGQALEIFAFSATAAMGLRWLFLLYPVVVIVPCALLILRRPDAVEEDPDRGGMSSALMWTVAGTGILGLIYLTIMFLPQAPLPTTTAPLEYPDFPYFIGLIAQVSQHWPPTSPGLSGVALPYEWFVFFHMAAISQVMHIPIPVIALRLDYVPTVLVVACQLLAVGRSVGRAAWTGALAVVIVFLLGPLDLISSATQAPFSNNVLVHLWDSWTFPFGLSFFLGLLYLITERLRAETWHTTHDLRDWALISLLMIGASGAKATVLPVIIVGTGLYAVLHYAIRRTVPVAAVVTTALGIVLFVATYQVVYAGSAPDTVISFMVWLAGTPPVVFVNSIHHTLVRDILLPFAYLTAFAGLLLPLVAMLYLLRRRHRHEVPSFAPAFCMLIAGLVIATFVHQSSYSEGYFEETAYLAGAIVSAAGLRLAWLDVGHALPYPRRTVVILFAGSIVILLAAIEIAATATVTPEADMRFYLVLAALGLVFILISALALRAGYGTASGALALGLIPLLAAAALTQPLLLYPTVRGDISGVPATPAPTVVPSGLLAALHWLRDHTSTDAVFAVNNHWLDPGRTNGKYYYYTAFSERQIFIEAYDPIRYGITPGIATPTEAIFAYRQGVNDAVFLHADTAALHTMTQMYGVRYLFIDRLLGTENPAVMQLGRVVFSDPDAVILAVG
ncbi:MAG: hypothetical protein WCB51_06695 [Candidatus Dormiibacterota bacterium]